MSDEITEKTQSKEPKRFGFSFKDMMQNINNGGKYLVITVIITFIVMVIACLAVFFASVQGAEQVMVPNVIGKPLTSGLLEMQAKELYPKIQLRYSDNEGDEGTILSQDPAPGAIVKAYRRVTLTISRGMAIDNIGDYTGQSYSSIKTRLQTLFSGETALVNVAEPVYLADSSPAGTIIAQFPAEGTPINSPVTLTLIVSNGDVVQTTTVPDLAGKSVDKVLEAVNSTDLIFNFTAVQTDDNKKVGTVISQDTEANSEITSYSRVDVEFATGQSTDGKSIFGIYEYELKEYPYPIPVRLEAVTKEGVISTIAQFNHSGNGLTIPYQTAAGTTLYLYVMEELADTQIVE